MASWDNDPVATLDQPKPWEADPVVEAKPKPWENDPLIGQQSPTPASDKALAETPTSPADARLAALGVDTAQPEASYVLGQHPIAENAAAATLELVGGMIPKSVDQYAKQLFPPLGIYDTYQRMRQGDFRDIPLVGRVQDIQEASKTPDWSKERFLAAGKTLMDIGLLAGGGEADAIKRSDAQMETRPSPLGVETRPQGEVTVPSDSDNVKRETQGEKPVVAGTPPETNVVASAAPASTVPESANVGAVPLASAKGFERTYGPGEIPTGQSLTPEDIFAQGQADLAAGIDPYAIAGRARTGEVSPSELGLLAAEHQRLVGEAAAAEGTPEYTAKYQQAKDFAQNMLKPAGTRWHQVGMGLQIEAPIDYSNMTGFRTALDRRFGREMTPEEAPAFEKVAKDVAKAKKEAQDAASTAADRVLKRFSKVPNISFEDAIKNIHDQITEELKPCNL